MKTAWPKYPDIYEINTRLWLRDLSLKYGRMINLSTVPEDEIKNLRGSGFDAIWLMGIWTPSPMGEEIAHTAPELRRGFLEALPDLKKEDILASPYAIKDYVASPALGGENGLKRIRRIMCSNGLKLILDFVPNHVACDHNWIRSNPEFFIRGTEEDLQGDPRTFFDAAPDSLIIAHGKDPYFPAWTDTAQLNYFHPGLRARMIRVLLEIAGKADGVRCDMAMLVLNEIQYRIWGDRLMNGIGTGGEKKAPGEFWQEAIRTVKGKYPDFLFVAESYWMKEGYLQALGFDYTYDKALYDWLRASDVISIHRYIRESPYSYQEKCLRFIENHDEPRARAVFGDERGRSAALLMGTLPGAHLYHEGQLEGFCIKYPVQLGRRRSETVDTDLMDFYEPMIKAVKSFREGRWILLTPYPAWEENYSYLNFIIYMWYHKEMAYLVVINLSPQRSQCYVQLPSEGIAAKRLSLIDLLDENYYERDGDILSTKGLYLDLRGYYRHLFRIKRT